MKFNWRNVLILAAIALVLTLAVNVAVARAENQSTLTVIEPVAVITPEPMPTLIPRIEQGATVYVNDTIDVSGVVPPYPDLAYWDGYDMYDGVPSYNITMPNNKKGYYNFYIDPAIFTTRPGKWYKYAGHFEKNSNNLAFIVSMSRINDTLTLPNGTVVNRTLYNQNVTPRQLNPEPVIVAERYVDDYLVARGDSLNVTVNGSAHVWLFGRVDGIYDRPAVDNLTRFNVSDLKNIEAGRYDLLIQYAGQNGLYEASYWKDAGVLHSQWKSVDDIEINASQPRLVEASLISLLKDTDDTFTLHHVTVQDPSIEITKIDVIPLGTHSEFDIPPFSGEVSLLDVRGYTNTAKGTNLTFVLDKDRQSPRTLRQNTFYESAKGSNVSNMRYFQVFVPVFWDQMAIGMHNVMGKTALGGSVQSDFPVSEMPADSYRPNATLKYIMDSNPYVPPVTVTVTVIQPAVTVVKTVTIPVTPSNDVVYAQQKKAEDAKWQETYSLLGKIALGLIGLVVLILIGRYALNVKRRLDTK